MKNTKLLKYTSIAFLASFLISMYLTKFKSIILGVDIPAYFIFAFTAGICAILLYSGKEIKEFRDVIKFKEKSLKEIPTKIYEFARFECTDEEEEKIAFVESNSNDSILTNFFLRYLDKENKDEIKEYIIAQQNNLKKIEASARKIVNYNNVVIIISTVAAYIYDSNIKGILLLATVFSILNLATTRNIDKNIATNKQILDMFNEIYEDILERKNPKMIMYKCQGLLNVEEDTITIDNFKTITATNVDNTNATQTTRLIDKSELFDANIEARKTALITIGKNKQNKNETESNKKEVSA